MRRGIWRLIQNLCSRTALRCGSIVGSVWFNEMGTSSKDAMVRMMKNSSNAEIWTQVGYFSDTPRMCYACTDRWLPYQCEACIQLRADNAVAMGCRCLVFAYLSLDIGNPSPRHHLLLRLVLVHIIAGITYIASLQHPILFCHREIDQDKLNIYEGIWLNSFIKKITTVIYFIFFRKCKANITLLINFGEWWKFWSIDYKYVFYVFQQKDQPTIEPFTFHILSHTMRITEENNNLSVQDVSKICTEILFGIFNQK